MIEVEGKIDNHPIEILIDSGASHSYINSNIVEIFHLQRSKHKKSWLVQLAQGLRERSMSWLNISNRHEWTQHKGRCEHHTIGFI
jgi:hypothetical protein